MTSDTPHTAPAREERERRREFILHPTSHHFLPFSSRTLFLLCLHASTCRHPHSHSQSTLALPLSPHLPPTSHLPPMTSSHSSFTTFSASTPDIWSPTVYGERYVEQRTRPGLELIDRLLKAPLTHPIRRAVDLGCGTGRFIPSLLLALKGEVEVVGLDTSRAMLDKAKIWVGEELKKAGKEEWASKVSYTQQNIAGIRSVSTASHTPSQPRAPVRTGPELTVPTSPLDRCSDPPVDLLFTNAALQWVCTLSPDSRPPLMSFASNPSH